MVGVPEVVFAPPTTFRMKIMFPAVAGTASFSIHALAVVLTAQVKVSEFELVKAVVIWEIYMARSTLPFVEAPPASTFTLIQLLPTESVPLAGAEPVEPLELSSATQRIPNEPAAIVVAGVITVVVPAVLSAPVPRSFPVIAPQAKAGNKTNIRNCLAWPVNPIG